jgi:hypothetical protein
MLMSSIIKLRWYNLIGALLFSIYGFLIGALPVGIINAFITLIDIYYIHKMYSKKESFKILEIENKNTYLTEFLKFYKQYINKIFPDFKYNPKQNSISFFILRNLAVAGIFLAEKYDEKTLLINLDFVIPEYRDFKLGKYIFVENKKYFSNLGYERLYAISNIQKHISYLKKMKFTEKTIDGKTFFVKDVN